MPTDNTKLIGNLLKRAAQDQTGWQQEVKPAGMGVYGDDYWDKLAMRPEPELPQFSQQQQAPKGMLPADWDYKGELGQQGEPLPYGAKGWLPTGEPDYGPGLAGWWNGLVSRMTAPVGDNGIYRPGGSLVVNKQTVPAGQDIWADFPSNAPEGGTQTTIDLPQTWRNIKAGEEGAALAYAARATNEVVTQAMNLYSEAGIKTKQTLGIARGIGEAADKAAPGKAITLENIREATGASWIPEQAQLLLDLMPAVTGFNSLLAWKSPEFRRQLEFDLSNPLKGGHPFLKENSQMDAAYQAGRMQYTAYIDPAARAEFIHRYNGYESAAALRAELENPWAELVGELIFDPLNFVGVGAKGARDAIRIAAASKEFVEPVAEVAEAFARHADVLDDVKAVEGLDDLVQAQMAASKRVAAGLDELAQDRRMLSLTAEGKRYVVARRAGETMGYILTNHGPDEQMEILRGLYLMASDNADEVAQGVSAARHAASPKVLFSRAGEELGVIMRRMMPEGPAKFMDELKAAQAEGLEAVIALVERKTSGAIDDMFPTVAQQLKRNEQIRAGKLAGQVVEIPRTVQAAARMHEILQKVYRPVNTALGAVYMGYSPGFAFRNGINNVFQALVDEGPMAIFAKPIERGEAWMGRAIKAEGFSGGTQGMETTGKFKGPASALAEKIEASAAARVKGHAIDKVMRRMVREGRALPYTDELVQAGLPKYAANRLVELIKQNKDVNKGLEAFKAEQATGLYNLFRDLSWVKQADRDALDAFGLTDEVEELLRTAESEEDALAGLDNILRQRREIAGGVANDLPGVDPAADTLGMADTMGDAMDAGDIAQDVERAAKINHYSQANAYTMFTYEAALRQVRKERPNDPIWAQVQHLLDYKLFDSDARKAHEARKATAVAMKQQAFKKGFDLEKNWKLLGLPGEAPKTPAAFVSAVWDDYYFPYVRKVWEDSRDSYVQAVEEVLAQVPPSDPRALNYARKQHALAREWDKVLVRDSIEKAVDAAKLRGDNAAVARMVAHQYGIASATEAGVPMDKRILDIINKYLPEGQDKYTSLADVPEDVAEAAFINRLNAKAGVVDDAAGAAADTAKAAEPAAQAVETPALDKYLATHPNGLKDLLPTLDRAFDSTYFSLDLKGVDDVELLDVYRDLFRSRGYELGEIRISEKAGGGRFATAQFSPIKKAAPKAKAAPEASEGLNQNIRQQLADLGYTYKQIDEMTPLQAQEAIYGKARSDAIEAAKKAGPLSDLDKAIQSTNDKLNLWASEPLNSSRIPEPVRNAMAEMISAMRSMVESGEPGRRVMDGNKFSHAIPSSYPKWYGELKRPKKDVLKAFERIQAGGSLDTGALAGRLKGIALDELLKTDPRVMLAIGDEQRAYDKILEMLDDGTDLWARYGDKDATWLFEFMDSFHKKGPGASNDIIRQALETLRPAAQASPTPPPNSAAPSYARALTEQMQGLEQLFNRLKQGVSENWGRVEPTVINRQIDAAIARYAKEANKRFSEARLIAAGVGNAARDFTLLSYPQKTGLDLALAYIYPYQFWYSRTYANWMKRLAYNPEVIAAYAKYKDYMAKIHAGAPEWWKYNINTNELLGMDAENPLFFNLEATLNPLNGLTGVDFDDPEKRVNWWTTNLDYLGRFGPSTWTPFSIVAALALYMNGEEEAAARWGGRIVPQTAALKSALSLLNVNIKTREGFNEFDLAVLFFSNGMDPFERRRVGRQLGMMVDQGLIDQATALDAARSQQGEVWDMAVQQAIKNRAAGQLSSFAFGVGFKARNLSDIAIDQFDQERRRLYAMKPDMSPEEYRDAWTQLKQKYPFADTVMLSRGSGPERDESYAFSVLGRIPPGQKDDLMELMGVSGALYDKFYDDKGNMSAWNPTDQQRFMAAVVDLGAILDLPDEATTREWNAAKDGYAAMQAEMRAQFGSDIQDKIDRYFAAKKNGTEAGEAVLQLYPEVQQALDFQAGRVVNSPDMAPYYSSIDKIERYYKGIMYNAIEAEVGADIWDKWDEYNLAQLDGTQRKYWREHPELERYIELRDDYQKVIAQAITNVAGKLKSPVFPALRDADNLSTGQQAALDAIQNPAPNPYRVSWEELSAGMSQPLQNLVLDYVYTGEDLPSAAKSQLEYLAGQMGVDYDTLMTMVGNSLR
jgi:hypothetical protein